MHTYFEKTLLTAQLHREVAASYYGFRIYARGDEYRTGSLIDRLSMALLAIPDLAGKVRTYPNPLQGGQWDWSEDSDRAMQYYRMITSEGWPEKIRGYPVSYARVTFPIGD